ncbi:MAG: erythromycin esterase family protein [Bryobacterales bacterium]|nr:erythromycin esterase family protein [Bryobacterales bacterium]
MTKRFPLTLIACLGLLSAAPSGPTDWIKTNAVSLKTVEAGHGFDDMAPLKAMVGDARIVALGEATHGSREFFQLKHRMLEFLVKEKGFTIFSINANMPEAYRLNDYVLEGKGDPAMLIKETLEIWDTEEVLAMIHWMREYNLMAKNKVQFTGFGMQSPNFASKTVEAFVGRYRPELLPAVRNAARLAGMAVTPAGPRQQFGAFAAVAQAGPLAGQTVYLRGVIRTAQVTGEANLWMAANGGGKLLASRNTLVAARGDQEWTKFDLELAIPPGAEAIMAGGVLAGGGTAWFDSLELTTAAGQPVPLLGQADLGFEAETLAGLQNAANAYEMALDKTVFHAGRQSLRLRSPAGAAPGGAPGAGQMSAEWQKIIEELEAARPQLAAKGVTPGETEWAVQNARVVRQSLQSQSGEVERDASMALNVSWILDRSPGAKMVLWAHNGHVAATNPNNRPMGAILHERYGREMVAFGLAFNQGSFRAIDQAKKELRAFTVRPAPAESFDGMVAAAGLPVMALDLRQAPAALRVPLAMRWAGGIYSAEVSTLYTATRVNPAEAFDAVLFVESTTAARANRPTQLLTQSSDGALRDAVTGVSVRLPEGWTLQDGRRYGQGEQTVTFTRSEAACGLWYTTSFATPRPDAEVAASLAKGIDEKTTQRLRSGLSGYRVLPESRRSHEVNGLPALTWQAEFYDNGRRMVETLTRVESPVAIALFFSRTPADQPLDIAPLAATLRLPASH